MLDCRIWWLENHVWWMLYSLKAFPNSVCKTVCFSKSSVKGFLDDFVACSIKLKTQKLFCSHLPACLLKVGSPVGFFFLWQLAHNSLIIFPQLRNVGFVYYWELQFCVLFLVCPTWIILYKHPVGIDGITVNLIRLWCFPATRVH